ncbi:probable pectinesterase/pectinesterase inhibitor 51 [Malania oleifera]|uniref:probable pectinesterase/pectinesterase inhibitor 51 n=1 Tax=Malania oleifera TaxID=397392 RepID=UPI0025ADDE9C|nr:probable pectinesterase/pectinesterase inhibitor 51 [Malania oleifera]
MHRKLFRLKPTPHSSFLLIAMASLSFLALLLFCSLSSALRHHHHSRPSPSVAAIPPEISQACNATRFSDVCIAALTQPNRVPPKASSIQIIQAAIQVSSENLGTAQTMVKRILDSSAGSLNRTTASKNCIEVLADSAYRTSSTVDALPRGRIKDARAWMSAALHYQYACWSGLSYANDTGLVNETMSFLDSLTQLTSNALSMIFAYDALGNDTGSWVPPQTERDGFWGRAGSGGGADLGYKGGITAGLKADATVCKDGAKGCYNTVQEAVNAAPSHGSHRFVIQIKAGVYEEMVRVPLDKTRLVFLGDGVGKTVITGSANADQPGVSTYNTATLAVLGDGFWASGLTIQNTAGSQGHQAVALRSDSDLSIFENCEFIGNQDTLYADSLRQFYKSCVILGNVDFVFGNSASVFQDCTLLVSSRQPDPQHGEKNAVTAQGRTDPAQATGFVFLNSLVNGTAEYMKYFYEKAEVHKNYLGRPWKMYSRTVFIQCQLEALIRPEGWLAWKDTFALSTLYYGEFQNKGAGADLKDRVTWSNQIPPEHVNVYSVENFIQGSEWIPTSS